MSKLKPKLVTSLPPRPPLTAEELRTVLQEGRELAAAIEARTAQLDQMSGLDFRIRLGYPIRKDCRQ